MPAMLWQLPGMHFQDTCLLLVLGSSMLRASMPAYQPHKHTSSSSQGPRWHLLTCAAHSQHYRLALPVEHDHIGQHAPCSMEPWC
jgi:hypothetical protein